MNPAKKSFKKLLFFKRSLAIIIIVLAIPITVYLVGRVVNFLSRASGTPANLFVDVGSSFDVPGGVWKNFAQGGEEKGRMLLSVKGKVKSLSPGYIRIDHIYDNYDLVAKEGSGNLTFNWTSLDATLVDIREIGATPFISLSYMPPVLSSGDVNGLPRNWGDWELIVSKTVEHISGNGGLNIPNVYYEVWNEPDLFGGWKVGGEKNYLNLYSHAVIGTKRAQNVNSFKIGGPATTGFYPAWVTGLLNFASNSGTQIDFISWHRYSKDLDDYEKEVFEAKGILGEEFPQFSNIELIISEFGPNSENDPVYDSTFSAIHTIAVAAVLENEISKAFAFEIKDGPGPEKYWGRWGLFTHEKYGEPEAKPRVGAINFLGRMSGQRVNVAGEGSWVKAFAKNDGKTVKTLVVNYDPKNKHTEAVPITFANLPSFNFRLRRIDYSGTTKEVSVATTSANWQTVELFNPNSVAIFEILPQ